MRPALALTATLLLSTACSSTVFPVEPGESEDPAPVNPTSDTETSGGIMGTQWQWVDTKTPDELIVVERPESYTLRLEPAGMARMQFDCNTGGGTYKLAGSHISFGPMISTRMACPPGSQDTLYMKQLSEVNSFFIRNGELFLQMPGNTVTMHFRRAPD